MILRIKELRTVSHMTQTDLAEKLGTTQTVVSSWETEVALPRIRQLPAIAMVLGVTIGELFAEEADAG